MQNERFSLLGNRSFLCVHVICRRGQNALPDSEQGSASLSQLSQDPVGDLVTLQAVLAAQVALVAHGGAIGVGDAQTEQSGGGDCLRQHFRH